MVREESVVVKIILETVYKVRYGLFQYSRDILFPVRQFVPDLSLDSLDGVVRNPS